VRSMIWSAAAITMPPITNHSMEIMGIKAFAQA
jgi:hypothetical protein